MEAIEASAAVPLYGGGSRRPIPGLCNTGPDGQRWFKQGLRDLLPALGELILSPGHLGQISQRSIR